MLLDNGIAEATGQAATFPWFAKLVSVRQEVVIEMIFNLGLEKFKGFKHAIEFIEAGQFFAVAEAMLRSKWADQVGARATELAYMMEKGEYLPDAPSEEAQS